MKSYLYRRKVGLRHNHTSSYAHDANYIPAGAHIAPSERGQHKMHCSQRIIYVYSWSKYVLNNTWKYGRKVSFFLQSYQPKPVYIIISHTITYGI